ncbi:hypothetical protein J4Q44_G00155580 [Coregonus suidteri]|uniref:Cytosolic carboxypeptidase N-terminal domain-containing protein n=1 Tax=Coregonus suidteri TaxID=861788 RepID=A0AAN8LPQ5_9TELE
MERKMEENMRDVDTGSEAGGEDALVGNVNKLMVTPPGYTGVPRKGHLVFDACFESGNLGRVDYISEFEFDLFIRPDTCNPRFRVWFNFTVENVRETQVLEWGGVLDSPETELSPEGPSTGGSSPLGSSSPRPGSSPPLPSPQCPGPSHQRLRIVQVHPCSLPCNSINPSPSSQIQWPEEEDN